MSTVTALTLISEDVYNARDSFDAALCDKSLNFEREAGFAIQQLSKNSYTMDIAKAARQSVFDAVVNVAAIGVSLNPAKKQAYLVPRDGKICLDISYMGLMDLAQATGSVKWAQAQLVYEKDTFSLLGLDKPPQHTFNPFATDRGDVVGVYVTIKTVHDEYLTHTMTIADVFAIRDRSQSWAKTKKGPWLTDEGEMIKKTCVKQAYKYWPKTDRLETAIHHLNTEGGEVLATLENATQQTAPKIPAMKGLGDDLPVEKKQLIESIAFCAIEKFEKDDLIGAYEECEGINEIDTGNDEKLYFWKQLPSKMRTAITKYKETLKGEK
jgi:recombination protein RecT